MAKGSLSLSFLLLSCLIVSSYAVMGNKQVKQMEVSSPPDAVALVTDGPDPASGEFELFVLNIISQRALYIMRDRLTDSL